MKKYLLMIALIIMAVTVSGCTSTSTISTKNITAGGMSFEYPDTWNASSQLGENVTRIVVANQEFISSNGTRGSVVLIMKVANTSTSNMTQARQELITQAQQSGQNVTSKTVTIAGLTASDISYIGNDTQGKKAYARLIDFEKNNNLYMLLFATGGGADVNSAQSSFDVIVKSFKVE
ncbi:MAG: hypothetical protein HVN35_07075 [Methanobacteriaceae archaeon]|nr:hypothetical protein [Methanobacteriaceae archaeon]